MTHEEYIIAPAKYRRGKMVIRCRPAELKERAARLAEAVGGRYTKRYRGYIVSPAKAARFEDLYKSGADACIMTGEIF